MSLNLISIGSIVSLVLIGFGSHAENTKPEVKENVSAKGSIPRDLPEVKIDSPKPKTSDLIAILFANQATRLSGCADGSCTVGKYMQDTLSELAREDDAVGAQKAWSRAGCVGVETKLLVEWSSGNKLVSRSLRDALARFGSPKVWNCHVGWGENDGENQWNREIHFFLDPRTNKPVPHSFFSFSTP